MKSAEYVGSVVAAYRYVIDHYKEDKKGAIATGKRILASDFARSKTTYWYGFENREQGVENAAGKILNPDQAGGTGLNIQSASVVVICEPQLKPSVENQAISRAYRMGQTRNVLVYRLLCENSVDEKIMSLLEEKQAIFDAFADQSEAANGGQDIDDKTFGNIIREEIDRIHAKHK